MYQDIYQSTMCIPSSMLHVIWNALIVGHVLWNDLALPAEAISTAMPHVMCSTLIVGNVLKIDICERAAVLRQKISLGVCEWSRQESYIMEP